MADALYGAKGFYRAPGTPARHFRTASHDSRHWPAAVAELARRVDASLGQPREFTIVDVGAGGGELLGHLASLTPPHWQLVGVDLSPRPEGLPGRVEWRDTAPATVTGVLLGVELLDVVPVDVVERTVHGDRLVEVDRTGNERLGPPPSREDTDWLERWWPLGSLRHRAEIGHPRDRLWRALADRVAAGVAIAIDYAVEPHRAPAGTLTGYRGGRQVAPVPDGSCDLTAHVNFESLRARDDVVLTQRQALRQLGVTARRRPYAGDAASHLRELAAVGEAAGLIDPTGLGGFTWLVKPVGIDSPLSAGGGDPAPPRRQSTHARRTSAHTSPTHP